MAFKKGHIVSKETCKKISDAKMGHVVSDETKRKSSISHMGHKHPKEVCDKISKSLIGNKRSLGFKQSEETKRKHAANGKGRLHTEESKRKMSEAQKGKRHSDETKAKLSALMMGGKRAAGHKLSDDAKRRIAEKLIGRFAGSNNPSWRGGVSFGKYCPAFNKPLKEEIRKRFDRKCFICGMQENGYKLHIHHTDYNKGQGCGHSWNLVALCRPCHVKTNFNRWHWFNLLSNYWALKYMDGGSSGEFFQLCGSGMPMFSGR
jgi:hypothetical protein